MDLPADFAFYGTLRRGGGALERLGLEDLHWRGACVVAGTLHRVSWYPALVAGTGRVVADLFRITDRDVVDVVDRFEGFDPADRDGSLYLRRRVRLVEPATDAWVYEWNGAVADLVPIPSGDWLAER